MAPPAASPGVDEAARALLEALADARRVAGRTVFRQGGRTGHLRGSAAPTRDGDALVIEAAGRWRGGGTTLEVRDATRWTPLDGGRLRVEHLRRGRDDPVRLGTLEPAPGGGWRTRRPHRCGDDRYRARVHEAGPAVLVRWRVDGPGKRGRVRRAYRPAGGGSVRP